MCLECDLSLDASSIAALVTSALIIIGVLAGAKWQLGKSKAAQLAQLLNLILSAAEDNTVSEEEFQGIVTAAKTLMDSSRLKSVLYKPGDVGDLPETYQGEAWLARVDSPIVVEAALAKPEENVPVEPPAPPKKLKTQSRAFPNGQVRVKTE